MEAAPEPVVALGVTAGDLDRAIANCAQIEPEEVAVAARCTLFRPRNLKIRDLVMLLNGFDI
jgi:hypothetical protein